MPIILNIVRSRKIGIRNRIIINRRVKWAGIKIEL